MAYWQRLSEVFLILPQLEVDSFRSRRHLSSLQWSDLLPLPVLPRCVASLLKLFLSSPPR